MHKRAFCAPDTLHKGWLQNISSSSSSGTGIPRRGEVIAHARRPVKPLKDHKEDDTPEPAASPPVTKYQEFLDAAPAAAATPAPASRAPRSNSSLARLEADMSSGLGSIAMFSEARLQLVEEMEQTQLQNVTRNKLAADGSRAMQRLSAELAEEGFDLDSDWGGLQSRASTTAAAKADTQQPMKLMQPPKNARFELARREDLDRRRRRSLFSSDDEDSGAGYSGARSSDDEAQARASARTLRSLPPVPPSAAEVDAARQLQLLQEEQQRRRRNAALDDAEAEAAESFERGIGSSSSPPSLRSRTASPAAPAYRSPSGWGDAQDAGLEAVLRRGVEEAKLQSEARDVLRRPGTPTAASAPLQKQQQPQQQFQQAQRDARAKAALEREMLDDLLDFASSSPSPTAATAAQVSGTQAELAALHAAAEREREELYEEMSGLLRQSGGGRVPVQAPSRPALQSSGAGALQGRPPMLGRPSSVPPPLPQRSVKDDMRQLLGEALDAPRPTSRASTSASSPDDEEDDLGAFASSLMQALDMGKAAGSKLVLRPDRSPEVPLKQQHKGKAPSEGIREAAAAAEARQQQQRASARQAELLDFLTDLDSGSSSAVLVAEDDEDLAEFAASLGLGSGNAAAAGSGGRMLSSRPERSSSPTTAPLKMGSAATGASAGGLKEQQQQRASARQAEIMGFLWDLGRGSDRPTPATSAGGSEADDDAEFTAGLAAALKRDGAGGKGALAARPSLGGEREGGAGLGKLQGGPLGGLRPGFKGSSRPPPPPPLPPAAKPSGQGLKGRVWLQPSSGPGTAPSSSQPVQDGARAKGGSPLKGKPKLQPPPASTAPGPRPPSKGAGAPQRPDSAKEWSGSSGASTSAGAGVGRRPGVVFALTVDSEHGVGSAGRDRERGSRLPPPHTSVEPCGVVVASGALAAVPTAAGERRSRQLLFSAPSPASVSRASAGPHEAKKMSGRSANPGRPLSSADPAALGRLQGRHSWQLPSPSKTQTMLCVGCMAIREIGVEECKKEGVSFPFTNHWAAGVLLSGIGRKDHFAVVVRSGTSSELAVRQPVVGDLRSLASDLFLAVKSIGVSSGSSSNWLERKRTYVSSVTDLASEFGVLCGGTRRGWVATGDRIYFFKNQAASSLPVQSRGSAAAISRPESRTLSPIPARPPPASFAQLAQAFVRASDAESGPRPPPPAADRPRQTSAELEALLSCGSNLPTMSASPPPASFAQLAQAFVGNRGADADARPLPPAADRPRQTSAKTEALSSSGSAPPRPSPASFARLAPAFGGTSGADADARPLPPAADTPRQTPSEIEALPSSVSAPPRPSSASFAQLAQAFGARGADTDARPLPPAADKPRQTPSEIEALPSSVSAPPPPPPPSSAPQPAEIFAPSRPDADARPLPPAADKPRQTPSEIEALPSSVSAPPRPSSASFAQLAQAFGARGADTDARLLPPAADKPRQTPSEIEALPSSVSAPPRPSPASFAQLAQAFGARGADTDARPLPPAADKPRQTSSEMEALPSSVSAPPLPSPAFFAQLAMASGAASEADAGPWTRPHAAVRPRLSSAEEGATPLSSLPGAIGRALITGIMVKRGRRIALCSVVHGRLALNDALSLSAPPHSQGVTDALNDAGSARPRIATLTLDGGGAFVPMVEAGTNCGLLCGSPMEWQVGMTLDVVAEEEDRRPKQDVKGRGRANADELCVIGKAVVVGMRTAPPGRKSDSGMAMEVWADCRLTGGQMKRHAVVQVVRGMGEPVHESEAVAAFNAGEGLRVIALRHAQSRDADMWSPRGFHLSHVVEKRGNGGVGVLFEGSGLGKAAPPAVKAGDVLYCFGSRNDPDVRPMALLPARDVKRQADPLQEAAELYRRVGEQLSKLMETGTLVEVHVVGWMRKAFTLKIRTQSGSMFAKICNLPGSEQFVETSLAYPDHFASPATRQLLLKADQEQAAEDAAGELQQQQQQQQENRVRDVLKEQQGVDSHGAAVEAPQGDRSGPCVDQSVSCATEVAGETEAVMEGGKVAEAVAAATAPILADMRAFERSSSDSVAAASSSMKEFRVQLSSSFWNQQGSFSLNRVVQTVMAVTAVTHKSGQHLLELNEIPGVRERASFPSSLSKQVRSVLLSNLGALVTAEVLHVGSFGAYVLFEVEVDTEEDSDSLSSGASAEGKESSCADAAVRKTLQVPALGFLSSAQLDRLPGLHGQAMKLDKQVQPGDFVEARLQSLTLGQVSKIMRLSIAQCSLHV